jgi:hypothetical protein
LSGLGLDFCDATFKLCIATLIVAARNGLGRFVGVSSLNLGRAFGHGPFFFEPSFLRCVMHRVDTRANVIWIHQKPNNPYCTDSGWLVRISRAVSQGI